jgi:hypothetical protein
VLSTSYANRSMTELCRLCLAAGLRQVGAAELIEPGRLCVPSHAEGAMCLVLPYR